MNGFFGGEGLENKKPINVNEQESAEASLKTEGGLNYYESHLQITDEDLRNKEILDLGSGPTTLFAKEAEERIPGAKITSLDFSFDKSRLEEHGNDFNDPRSGWKLERSEAEGKTGGDRKVSGLFTNLPFRDESFDLVVSSGAMPLYLTNPEQIKEAFREVARVLRQGGKAHLGPVTFTDVVDKDFTKSVKETHRKHPSEESKKVFMEALKEIKDQTSFKFLPEIKSYNQRTQDIDIISPEVLVITKKTVKSFLSKILG